MARLGIKYILLCGILLVCACTKEPGREDPPVPPPTPPTEKTVELEVSFSDTIFAWGAFDAFRAFNDCDGSSLKCGYAPEGKFRMTVPAEAKEITAHMPYSDNDTREAAPVIFNMQMQSRAGVLNRANVPLEASAMISDSTASLEFHPRGLVLAVNVSTASGLAPEGINCITAIDGERFSRTCLETALVPEASPSGPVYICIPTPDGTTGITLKLHSNAVENNVFTVTVNPDGTDDIRNISVNLDEAAVATGGDDLPSGAVYDGSDNLSAFLAGAEIDICGQKVSLNTVGRYTSMRPCDLEKFDMSRSLAETGVIFLDNNDTTASVNTCISGTDSRFGQDAIYIGRRTDRPQPVIKGIQQADSVSSRFLLLAGKNMFKNIRLHMDCTAYRARDGYCGLARWTGLPRSVPCELYMDGCTYISDAGYGGLVRQINDKGPRVIRCDNSIVACTSDLITGKVGEGSEAAISDYEEISFNNCILCHANSDYGRLMGGMLELVAFRYGNNPRSDKLCISLDHCTVYNIHPTAYGFFQLNSVKSVSITNSVFCAESLPYTQGTKRPLITLYETSSPEQERVFNYKGNYRESRGSEKTYVWNMEPDETTGRFFTSWTVAGDFQLFRENLLSVEDREHYRFETNRSSVGDAGADCRRIRFQ